MNIKTYSIIIAYDGTDFHGWQQQPHDDTVTSCLEAAWLKTFGHSINILGASRTDTGVHALGQVARIRTDLQIDPSRMLKAWNARLPSSIRIRSINLVADDFNPLRNVKQKTYYYTLFLKPPLPFVARFGWHYIFINDVDLDIFARGLQLYVGTHDFGSFCKKEFDDESTVRTIDKIDLYELKRWGALIVSIKGAAFAHFQIRRMIGYALDVARRKELSLDYLEEILKNPNPKQTLVKADPQGLCLRKIVYKDHDERTE